MGWFEGFRDSDLGCRAQDRGCRFSWVVPGVLRMPSAKAFEGE